VTGGIGRVSGAMVGAFTVAVLAMGPSILSVDAAQARARRAPRLPLDEPIVPFASRIQPLKAPTSSSVRSPSSPAAAVGCHCSWCSAARVAVWHVPSPACVPLAAPQG